jgi:methionine sulfoxide reductase heme-binding subunit
MSVTPYTPEPSDSKPSLISRIWNAPPTFWLLLSLPALPMLSGFFTGDYKHVLHPTGEFAARFMIVSMMLTPLMMLFPSVRAIRWLMKRRRHIGVAAFAYAMLHTLAYVMQQGTLQKILGELPHIGMWTGWLAMLVFVPLAFTSNDAALRFLGRLWKPMQRLSYAAAVITLAHWIFVSHEMGGIIVHAAPLVLLELYRIGRNLKWWSFRLA